MFPVAYSTPTQQVALATRHLKKAEEPCRLEHSAGVSCLPAGSLPLYRIKIKMET